jgi:4-carboxymuconolactone decarboxylase
MTTTRVTARAILRDMQGEAFAAGVEKLAASKGFGAGIAARSLDDCYGHYWADDRLDRRSRSLVTLGMVIALRASAEVKNHVRGALANGVTPQEIEALIEHAVAYLGYPTAGVAMVAAREVITGQAMDMTAPGGHS